MHRNAIRVGGLCGVAAAATAVPAYIVGSPELPNTPAKLSGYYERSETFMLANGTLPLAHLLLGIVFIAVVVAVLRAAMGPEPAVYMALIGGAVFIALTAAGLAAEVAIPAVIATFGNVIAVEVLRPFLALSVWLYHYSQIGSAVLIFATSYGIWRTGVLPKWTAVGALLGIVALSHTWIGLPAAYGTVAWVALVGLLLLAVPPSANPVEGVAKKIEGPAKKSSAKHHQVKAGPRTSVFDQVADATVVEDAAAQMDEKIAPVVFVGETVADWVVDDAVSSPAAVPLGDSPIVLPPGQPFGTTPSVETSDDERSS